MKEIYKDELKYIIHYIISQDKEPTYLDQKTNVCYIFLLATFFHYADTGMSLLREPVGLNKIKFLLDFKANKYLKEAGEIYDYVILHIIKEAGEIYDYVILHINEFSLENSDYHLSDSDKKAIKDAIEHIDYYTGNYD